MKKLLVDIDTGVDDAQSLMIALSSPNVKILGITCVHGNTSVDNVCKNTLRVLQVCGKLDVSAAFKCGYFISLRGEVGITSGVPDIMTFTNRSMHQLMTRLLFVEMRNDLLLFP